MIFLTRIHIHNSNFIVFELIQLAKANDTNTKYCNFVVTNIAVIQKTINSRGKKKLRQFGHFFCVPLLKGEKLMSVDSVTFHLFIIMTFRCKPFQCTLAVDSTDSMAIKLPQFAVRLNTERSSSEMVKNYTKIYCFRHKRQRKTTRWCLLMFDRSSH